MCACVYAAPVAAGGSWSFGTAADNADPLFALARPLAALFVLAVLLLVSVLATAIACPIELRVRGRSVVASSLLAFLELACGLT